MTILIAVGISVVCAGVCCWLLCDTFLRGKRIQKMWDDHDRDIAKLFADHTIAMEQEYETHRKNMEDIINSYK